MARFLGVGTIAALLVLATFAIAQPPAPGPRGAHKPRPPAVAADAGAAEPAAITDAGAALAPPSPSGSSEGAIPAPPSDSFDGGRLSPLNPAPNEFSDAAVASPPDYDKLLADIASLRTRVAAVSDTLFHARIAVAIEASGSHGRVASLSVSLDDGIVWTSPASFRADASTVVYEHSVAPGHHAVSVEVERRDDRNDNFRSTQRSRFIVDVPADQRLAVEIKLSDDSNMGADFPANKSGDYALNVRMNAKAQPAGK